MDNRGKGMVVDTNAGSPSNCRVGGWCDQPYYFEGRNGATTAHEGQPAPSVEHPTQVWEGVSIDSAPTKYLKCSDFINRANLIPDKAISPDEWNLLWESDEPEPLFADRYTHHLPPPSWVPLGQIMAKMYDFVQTFLSLGKQSQWRACQPKTMQQCGYLVFARIHNIKRRGGAGRRVWVWVWVGMSWLETSVRRQVLQESLFEDSSRSIDKCPVIVFVGA